MTQEPRALTIMRSGARRLVRSTQNNTIELRGYPWEPFFGPDSFLLRELLVHVLINALIPNERVN